MNAKFLPFAIPALALSILPFARGAQNLETDLRKNGDTVVAAFEEQRAVLQRCSAVLKDGRKEVAYGVVVSADGYILTKASEIENVSGLTVTVDAARFSDARVVAIDPVWDVALVKVEAQGLQPVTYASNGDLPQGTWVVANGVTSLTKRRALVGIISAKPREISAGGGTALGIVLKEDAKILEIDSINEKSGAHAAGLLKGDVIVSVDGKKVGKMEELAEALKDRKAGTTVKVTYKRKGKEQTVDVRLVARGEISDEKSRNDEMSGEFSKRRTGFPRIIQHDILGRKDSVGGPLLDLNGHCVGMNIARADRAQSFAIPMDDVKALAAKMIKEAGR